MDVTEDYFMTRTAHVLPAFGSWDSGEYLQFTEYFQSATEPYNYQEEALEGDEVDSGDLYVTGDLYQNDGVTSAVIIVPRHRSKPKRRGDDAKQGKKQSRWGEPDELNEYWPQHNASSNVKAAKPVDEDLYRISPELLHRNNINKKRGFGFGLFASCCMVATCFT